MSNANWSSTKNLNVLADGVQIDDNLCESVGQTNAIMHIMAALAPGASPTFADLDLVDDVTRPVLNIDHMVATPASGTEVGRIGFRGEDSIGQEQAYAQIRGYVDDDTNGAEKGYLTVHAAVAGTPTERFRVSNAGVRVIAELELGSGGPKILWGTGTPESAVTAGVGSTFHRTDGGAGTSFYVKESGTGNTGWVAK